MRVWGHFDFLNMTNLKVYLDRKSHERVIRACFVRELVDGPTTALCKCGVLTAPVPPPGQRWFMGAVSLGRRWSGRKTSQQRFPLVVQIRHLRRHHWFIFSDVFWTSVRTDAKINKYVPTLITMGVRECRVGTTNVSESFGAYFSKWFIFLVEKKSEKCRYKQEERKQHSQSCRLEISLVSEQCLNVDLFQLKWLFLEEG